MSFRTKLYWSVRRELWENTWIYLAPLALAGLVVLAFSFHMGEFTQSVRALPGLGPERQVKGAVQPFALTGALLLFASWLFGVFYSLDALNGERRDRSILFWKSMPVSDLTTVVGKALVPLVLLPLVALAVAIATHVVILLVTTAVLAAKGTDPGILWSRVPFAGLWTGMLYGMAVHALWYAPFFGYVLMVSAWVRRSPFLWVVLPFLAAYAIEAVAFGTSYVLQFLKDRFLGGMRAFKPEAVNEPITQLSQLDPGRFFTTPGLWIGLAFAIAFLAAAVRLRRYRDPT